MTETITRFAPSPTGHLHLGHAYAALFAAECAEQAGGRYLLRIEDIDQTRCKPEFEALIYEDLAWLGLAWEIPVRRQSEHMAEYQAALDRLAAAELLYPCFCTRKDILREVAAAGYAPHTAEGPIYPGTCRGLSADERQARIEDGVSFALRLDAQRAVDISGPLSWNDRAAGDQAAQPDSHGDVVLARKDIPTSYHLAVTVDDAAQGITLVVRGEDLFGATHVHRLLQALLNLPVPDYHHHPLLTNAAGERLAKRDRAISLRALREAGNTPADIRRMISDLAPG
jgi:glutamyl-Q tRNA(Asp) synthetase